MFVKKITLKSPEKFFPIQIRNVSDENNFQALLQMKTICQRSERKKSYPAVQSSKEKFRKLIYGICSFNLIYSRLSIFSES